MDKKKRILILVLLTIICVIITVTSSCNKEEVKGLLVTKKINLYTSLQVDIVENIISEFERENPKIEVEVFRAGTAKLMERISQEMNETGIVGADVIWLADFSAAEGLKEKGVLQKYVSPEVKNIIPVFIDEQGYYTGSMLFNMVVTYNKDTIMKKPEGYRDLLNPQWKEKIGIVDPRACGFSQYTIGTLLMERDFGWEYYYKLFNESQCKIVDNDSLLTQKIADGELYMGITTDFNARRLLMDFPAQPLDYLFPEHGVVLAPSPIAISKDCRDIESSREFIDWVLSRKGQEFMSKKMSITPVRLDIETPEGMKPLRELKVIPSTAKTIFRNKENINKVFSDIFSGKSIEAIEEEFLGIEKGIDLAFGVSSIESPGNIYEKFQPFTDYLGKELGVEVRLVQKRTYEEINESFKTADLDFARIAAGAYVKIKEETDVIILALESKNDSPNYQAYIIVHRDSPITSFDGLRGKSFAFVDRDSNSGFIYPEFLITQRNTDINTFFSQHAFTGGHDNSIMKVLNKEVDGASVASYILEREADANPEIKDKINIIQKSPTFFRGPIIARNDMPQDLREQIKEILLNMHLDEEGRAVLETMKLDGFREGKDADFDSIRVMLGVLEETK